MKILIYTTHRTGSTSLAQLLMNHYKCDYQREWFYKNNNFIKKINTIKNIIVKLTPEEVDYNNVRNYFDKCIVLTRECIKEQAESRLYADKVKKNFIPYVIDSSFIENNQKELIEMEKLINFENDLLKKCDDCLHITYEELYYDSGVVKLKEYLEIIDDIKLDNSKKYRNGKRSLL